jgi:hypothetical protein
MRIAFGAAAPVNVSDVEIVREQNMERKFPTPAVGEYVKFVSVGVPLVVPKLTVPADDGEITIDIPFQFNEAVVIEVIPVNVTVAVFDEMVKFVAPVKDHAVPPERLTVIADDPSDSVRVVLPVERSCPHVHVWLLVFSVPCVWVTVPDTVEPNEPNESVLVNPVLSVNAVMFMATSSVQ